MRAVSLFAALVAVSACTGNQIPDSGAGVGFGNFEEYAAEQQARDSALAGNALPPPNTVSEESLAQQNTGDLGADTVAALDANKPTTEGGFVQADPNNPQPVAVNSDTGISQENDFGAVDAQRSIESDAQKIAQNRAQYKVIEAEALPQRSGNSGPNIVEYALTTKHPRGTQVYRRIGINLDAKSQRNCAKYASPDLAQSEFLSKGGPKRDRLALDPDGDGYACSWDPSPFRKAVGG